MLVPENGSFAAYIVVPERASEIERYAAGELAAYIDRITGAGISVIHEKPNLEYFGFYIGQTARGGSYAPPRKSTYEGANGFRLKAVPNGLVIAGGDDLSTLFGVYAFLEEYQGCGWYMPYELGQVIPKNNGIVIPENLDVTQVPDIPIRWIGSGDWALANRMNTGIRINGHEAGVIMKWNFHTFRELVPAERYFDDHPEYYSLLDKKAMKQYHDKDIQNDAIRYWGIMDNRQIHWQLCTSNPEVVRLVSQHLVENLERNPSIEFISLTANDGYGFCQCGHCSGQVEPERVNDRPGAVTGPIHLFNNRVAKRVKKYRPDQFIKIGAYASYYRYPLAPGYRPEDNIAVQVTPNIQFCHNHAITDPACPYNADFMNDFSMWVRSTRHLHIYGYASLHGWAQLPWPMVHAIRKDIPEYHRLGVELYFTQYWYLSLSYALNYHISSRLAWDTSLNVDELITEFCRRMYGAAAPEMERYHRFIEDSWEQNPNHVGYWVEATTLSMPKFFPPDVTERADYLLREAEGVRVDSLPGERVHQIRIDLDYLRLVLNYLEAISKPFQGIDPEANPIGWENAVESAASIGEPLSRNIMKYLDDYYPASIKTVWGSAVANMLRAHVNPARIPGAQRTQ